MCKKNKQGYLFFFQSDAPGAPGELGQPLPHHHQLSLTRSDHHLNYLLSCPPDGFFANYNFFVDGQRIMTAEVCAMAAGWNTKRANGCRCVCKIQPLCCTCTHRRTPKHEKDTRASVHFNTHTVHRCWCKHTHTHTQTHARTRTYTQTNIPPPPVEKPFTGRAQRCQALKWIYERAWCVLSSPALARSVSLTLFEAERNSFILQNQIHEKSGKMYSYHRWSYYGRGKLSNENIIHRKWHLNTYQPS